MLFSLIIGLTHKSDWSSGNDWTSGLVVSEPSLSARLASAASSHGRGAFYTHIAHAAAPAPANRASQHTRQQTPPTPPRIRPAPSAQKNSR
eukprot:6561130-Pyramimonas_sp.AAC.1